MKFKLSPKYKKTPEGYLEYDYSKTRLVHSLKGYPKRDRTPQYAVVRTSFYKRSKKKIDQGSREKREQLAGDTFSRQILKKGQRYNFEINTRTHYVRIAKKDISDVAAVERKVEKYMKREQGRFLKSSFNSMSGSVQYVKGKIVDKYTCRVTPKSKVSKASTMPAFSKKLVKGQERGMKRLKEVSEVNLNAMLDGMQEMAEYGMGHPWKPGEYRRELPLGQGQVREMKHESSEEEQ